MKRKEELLTRAVELYYEQNLNQSEVAKIIGTSRPMVSRLLNEARATGVVEIIIHNEISKNPELSNVIRTKFGLRDAIIISGDYSYEEAIQKCGKVAVNFLNSILENNMTIGISWGPPIDSFCNALEKKTYYNVHVVQMVGCLGTGNPHLDGVELAYRISSKLNATYSNIIAPAFVDNKLVQEYLIFDSQIESTIKRAMNTDIILTGIGSISGDQSSLEKAGYLTKSERQKMVGNGCVGHMLARYFDSNGKEMFIKDKFPISAPLEALNKAKWSIGIGASTNKALPVITAIKNGFINTLIADEALAREMLLLSE